MGERWFRFYEGALDDPKVQTLPADDFRAWVNLLCLACRQGGRLPPEQDIAFALRMDLNACRTVLERLLNAGLIDRRNGGANGTHYAPHAWEKRQYKSDNSTGRVKRFRERSATVTETPPDTDTDTDKRKMPDAAAPAPDPTKEERDLFDRGKAVLGASAGGVIKKLVKAKGGSIPLARAAIEQAATKQSPREYIGAILRGHEPAPGSGGRVMVAI